MGSVSTSAVEVRVNEFKVHGMQLQRELQRAESRGLKIRNLDDAEAAELVIAKADKVYRSITQAVGSGQGIISYASRFIDAPVFRVMNALGVSEIAGYIAYDAVLALMNKYLAELVKDVAAVNVLLDEMEESQNEF